MDVLLVVFQAGVVDEPRIAELAGKGFIALMFPLDVQLKGCFPCEFLIALRTTVLFLISAFDKGVFLHVLRQAFALVITLLALQETHVVLESLVFFEFKV